MKVVHVMMRYDLPGGIVAIVREIAPRHRAAGIDVEVFASDLFDEARWEQRSSFPSAVDGVPVRRFPIRRRLLPGVPLSGMIGLVDALRESGADVIHAHNHRYGHVLQATAVADRCGIPLVVSTYYHPAQRYEPRWKRGLIRALDLGFGMTAYRTASAIVALSHFEAGVLGQFAPRDRIHVIPPGIDLSEWSHPESDLASGLPLPPEYFLFVGRIAPNKGLPNLLGSLARLPPAARRPLVLMGADGGKRHDLELLAAGLGVSDSVVWLGHVPDRSAYRAVVRGARALVLPSEWESFGLVLLEAMAAGTPIIATRVGAVPEVLAGGQAGLLVPFADPTALAHALASVVDQPEAARARAVIARAKAEQLSWSAAAERLGSLYRSVVRA